MREPWLTESHLRLEEFLAGTGKTSQLSLIQVDALRECDNRCSECLDLEDDVMLCEGVRMAFNQEESTNANTIRIHQKVCPKRELKESDNSKLRAFRKTLISDAFVHSALAAQGDRVTASYCTPIEESGESGISVIYKGLKHFIPALTQADSGVEFRRAVQELMIGAVLSGLRPVYLHSSEFGQFDRRSPEELSIALVEECDWLVVDRFDLKVGAPFRREALVAALQRRMLDRLPLTVTWGQEVARLDGIEKEFLKEVDQWATEFPKALL